MLTAEDIRFYATIDFKDFSIMFKSYHNGRRQGLKVSGFFDISREAQQELHDKTLARFLVFFEANKDKELGPWG